MTVTKSDHERMTEDENAMIVALHAGSQPNPDDPLCKALEARGLARRSHASWELTADGVDHVAELGQTTRRGRDAR
jgi:hypothetical protein